MTNKLKILSRPLAISDNYLQDHTLYNTGWRREGVGVHYDVRLIHYQNRFAWLTTGNVNHRSVLVDGILFGTMWRSDDDSIVEYIGYIDLTADVWEWTVLRNMEVTLAVIHIQADAEFIVFSWGNMFNHGGGQIAVNVNTRTIVESNAKCN